MKIDTLIRHRLAILGALATWGVGCGPEKTGQSEEGSDEAAEEGTDGGSETGGESGDTGGEEFDACFPEDHPDPEQCQTTGCVVPMEDQDESELSFYFCLEVDEPSECVSCGDQEGCSQQARYLLNLAEPGTGSPQLSQTQCGPAEWEDSCCYIVLFRDDAIPGRPFAVRGQARTAGTLGGEPTAAPNARLARHWRRVAELEHASVASFARFTLQLMALGAPSSLLAQAQHAGLDEVEHARLAYGLARRFGGSVLKAGPLSLAGALEPGPMTDPETILRATLREGCIGETLAAATAAMAAQRCEDQQTKAVLEQIAEDELRHATLAWETLAWAREAFPEALRRALVGWKREVEPFAEDSDGAPEWGVLGRNDELLICRRVMESTIAPAIQQLLS